MKLMKHIKIKGHGCKKGRHWNMASFQPRKWREAAAVQPPTSTPPALPGSASATEPARQNNPPPPPVVPALPPTPSPEIHSRHSPGPSFANASAKPPLGIPQAASEPETRNPKLETQNGQPSTLNSQPSALNAFITLRANGWSYRSISKKLGIPKSTLFNWESDKETRGSIDLLKALQVEKLQERYLPSYEEDLQKLSVCLTRIERALEKHDFESMRPEFLLRASLQVRARLNDLRSDIQPIRGLDHGQLPPTPVPGCISRSDNAPDVAEVATPVAAESETSHMETHEPAGCSNGAPAFGVRSRRVGTAFHSPGPRCQSGPDASGPHSKNDGEPSSSSTSASSNQASDLCDLRAFAVSDGNSEWDKTENSRVSQPSLAATCKEQSGTLVPSS